MIPTKAQRSPLGLVALALAFALGAYVVYALRVAIPAKVQVELEATAGILLQRLAVTLALDPGFNQRTIDRLLQLERADPQLLHVTLLDEHLRSQATLTGRPATTSVAFEPTGIPPALLSAAQASAMHPRFVVQTEPRRLLLAAMSITDPTLDRPSAPGHLSASQSMTLYLVMDLQAAIDAEGQQLLSWSGVFPWALSVAIALLAALLLDRRSTPASVLATGSRMSARNPGDGRGTANGEDAIGARIADLDHILDIAAVLLVGLDERGRVRLINQKGCDVLGLDRGEILGQDWVDHFIPERDREATRQIISDVIAGNTTPLHGVEGTILCADGSERLIEWNNSPIRDHEGTVIGGLGSGTDITERKQAERALSYLVTLETVLVETSRSLVAAPAEAVGPMVENALGAVARRMKAERAYVFVLSRDGTSMRNTQEWSATGMGIGAESAPRVSTSLIPRWMETLQYGDDIRIDDVTRLPDTWSVDREQLEQLEVRAVAAVAIRVAGRIGGFVAVEMLSETRVWRDSERALGFLGDLIGGAFERRRSEFKLIESRKKLEEIALYDPLTRLPNRRLLAERMDEAVVQAGEQGFLLGVCYLDLDGFKPINDTHGHKMGDRVLVTVASRLRACVREEDTVARLGGDEFVLLMTHLESLSDSAALMDRVLASLAQPILIDGHSLGVTGSAGVTLFPQDAGDADTLLRHADQAMYQAKQQGRNRYQFFTPVEDQPDQAHQRELVRIREAIEGHELRLHVQPRVDMCSGRVVGVEALVRWQHPERGLLPPGEFLPLMEGDELLHDLDWWVMEQSLALLGEWQEAGLNLTMSLNLSARSLEDMGFVATLQKVLERHPSIDPKRLELEIIESEALRDIETTASVIRACAVLGVRFALDGFGNGFASLTDFRCLPAQIVKIDQSVVRDILRSRDDRHLVQGVIGIAHAFEREVIAEGVESAMHGLLLMDLGCTLAQGFGIAEPMPPEQLASWISAFRLPRLWAERPAVDWAAEDLSLLSMEAVHRAWVARLVRHVSTEKATKLPELHPEACNFGRWYLGEGHLRYGQLTEFRQLDAMHRRVHEQAELLVETSSLDRDAIAEPLAHLIGERDVLIAAIRALQAEVLQRRNASDQGREILTHHSTSTSTHDHT